MNPTYKRSPAKPGPVKSYVAAVRHMGDSWRHSDHNPGQSRAGSREVSEAYATPDFSDYVLMNLMERGKMPRVRDRDLYGVN